MAGGLGNSRPWRTDVPAFLQALGAGDVTAGIEAHLDLPESGGGGRLPLPVRLLMRPLGDMRGRTLVVTFHGAIDQTRRGFPIYEGGWAVRPLAGTDTVVLAIADPSLWLAPELTAAWYAPNHLLDVPRALKGFLAALRETLAPRRTIFAGGSTGGHAALVQAALAGPAGESVCIAFNPITRISHYYSGHIARYLAACWPGVDKVSDLPESFLDDCAVPWRAGPKSGAKPGSALILLQNATDHHLQRQGLAFAAQVGDPKQMLFLSSFFPDAIGHAFPAAERAVWLVAAVRAPAADARAIAVFRADRHELRSETITEQAPAAERATARDLDFAARIATAAA